MGFKLRSLLGRRDYFPESLSEAIPVGDAAGRIISGLPAIDVQIVLVDYCGMSLQLSGILSQVLLETFPGELRGREINPMEVR